MKSRRITSTGHVARIRRKGKAYKILLGKREGKRGLRGPRHRWVVSVKMDF
jgi:hypothetical protein